MPRRVEVVVLCEDEAHQSFAYAFLKRIGLPIRTTPRIRMMEGKGKVLNVFPDEVRSLRKQGGETHLFVLIDADERSNADLQRALNLQLTEQAVDPLGEEDRVFVIVPRWEIDNWVRCLNGGICNEVRDRRDVTAEEARSAAIELAGICNKQSSLPASLPSLIDACQLWNTYRQHHDL